MCAGGEVAFLVVLCYYLYINSNSGLLGLPGAEDWWERRAWDDPFAVPYPQGHESSNLVLD